MNPDKTLLTRKLNRIALFIELIYVIFLAYAITFNFSLFAHLIVGQFFLVIAYFLTGWIYILYLRASGQYVSQHYRKRESLADKFANVLPHYTFKKSFYRFLGLTVILSSAVYFFISLVIVFQDLSLPTNNFDIFDSFALYTNMANQIFLFGLLIGLLMGYKRTVRNSSIGIMICSIVLAICWPHLWLSYLVMLVTGFLGLILFIRNQI